MGGGHGFNIAESRKKSQAQVVVQTKSLDEEGEVNSRDGSGGKHDVDAAVRAFEGEAWLSAPRHRSSARHVDEKVCV